MCDHSANFCSLCICGWMCCTLSVIIARSFAYAIVMHTKWDLLKWYFMSSFFIHLKSDFKNMMNMQGLRVSSCMVSRLLSIGGVVPKWFLVKDEVESLYMFPTISSASNVNPKSSMRVNSLAWSMKPKASQKSMYVRYMYLLVSHASSRVALIIQIRLVVMWRSLHCKVEQPRAKILYIKNLIFYIKHHKNGSNLYQFFL